MKFYQFKELHRENFNAGSKAVEDAFEIARRLGTRPWRILRFTESDFPFPRCVNRLIGWLVWKPQEIWLRLRFPGNAVLFVQHPLTTGRALTRSEAGLRLIRWLRERRGLRVITLVHDISELRSGDREVNKDMPDSIENVLSYSDVLIVHNESMRKWLVAHGAAEKPLVILGMFDYLTDVPFPDADASGRASVTFAGNLRPDKCGFLKQADKIPEVKWFLYGAKFDPSAMRGAGINYCGCMKPSELPQHLCRGFGLVWDGDDLDACTGEWGEYLRWNNPHKLSLYLASGLPVITWSKAATAAFVKEHDVGFAVDSLRDIPMMFAGLTAERYLQMCGSARRIAQRLRAGEFLSSALHKALDVCEQE